MPARLHLVVPCYNEARRLKGEAFLELVTSRPDTSVLFVDDGSTDGTPALLDSMVARGGGKIGVLTLPANVGKARAVQRGLLAALENQPDLVGYWDADLSTPLTAVADFLQALEIDPQVDIVIGSRVRLLGRRIDRNAIRHYIGRGFATAASLVLRVGVYDTQCGAKIFRANALMRQIFSDAFRSRWIVDVEILARYIAAVGPSAAQSRICELPLRTWTEVPGSNLGWRHGLGAVWDLASIWRRRGTRLD